MFSVTGSVAKEKLLWLVAERVLLPMSVAPSYLFAATLKEGAAYVASQRHILFRYVFCYTVRTVSI
jgi:hypothetical protein